MTLSCWHYEIDTIPNLSVPREDRTAATRAELRIPFGVWVDRQSATSRQGPALRVTVDLQVDDAACVHIGFDGDDSRGLVRSITKRRIALERRADARAARWYLAMETRLAANGSQGNQYFEAVVPNVPIGSRIRYTIRISALPVGTGAEPSLHVLGPYTFHAVTPPRFEERHAFFASDGNGGCGPGCVLFYTSDDRYHYVRADFDDVSTTRAPFDLTVGSLSFCLGAAAFAPAELPSLPHIDPFADTVVAVIPREEVASLTDVFWHGRRLDVASPTGVGRARLMFIHYCMQGLNDLFERPNAHYQPPRTYMQTTMRDEDATYSSRPESVEREVGDGYWTTLEAHRRHGIRHLWTFNGGVLALMAHDCPADLAHIKEDIAAGLLDPTIAGFGGHRLPYYQEETNAYSIELGKEMMTNVLGSANDVYYLDQRLYKQIPNVTRALVGQGIRYIVVDERTGFDPYRSTARPSGNASPQADLDGQCLWQDASSGLYLLFIANDMKENLFSSTDEETARGKLALSLRRKFLYFAANPAVRDRNLLIYSDDADKASGNGWFDGDYDGVECRYPEKYAAALEWIAAHPWIQAVTSADLTPADCVGTVDMKTAIDPVLDPGGADSVDLYGKELHFDAWYDSWKEFEARWVGKTLETISQEAEYAIVDWHPAYRNDLYQLARMYFSMALHESQWNKQPLESLNGLDPNQRRDVVEPEDFVIGATLQIRNTHVYLAASVWASWAAEAGRSPRTYVNDGPLLDRLTQVRYAERDRRPELAGRRIFEDALRLDQDLLENVVLYNDDVLVVIDRNGGRITHVFAILRGNGTPRPVCVSGTPKCWQFLTGDPAAVESFACDGEVMQNTVYTPNHAFIACDVKQAAGTLGTKANPKSSLAEDERERVCWYPDNFNAYDLVEAGENFARLHYQQTMPAVPMDLSTFRRLLEIDRQEKSAGRRGVVFHPFPSFSKTISLTGRRITVAYEEVEAGHVAANELCGDVHRSLLHGERHARSSTASSVAVAGPDGAGVTLTLGDNCAFTAATLEAERNRRLHRVMTDCVEVKAIDPGDFSYHLDVSGARLEAA